MPYMSLIYIRMVFQFNWCFLRKLNTHVHLLPRNSIDIQSYLVHYRDKCNISRQEKVTS